MFFVIMSTTFGVVSGKIDGVALQIRKHAILERGLMCRAQHDTRSLPRLERLLPARRTEAPAISFLQPRKSKCRDWCRKIVAARFREGEESFRNDHAHRVTAEIFRARIATTVAEKSRERGDRAALERFPEHVSGFSPESPPFGFDRHRLLRAARESRPQAAQWAQWVSREFLLALAGCGHARLYGGERSRQCCGQPATVPGSEMALHRPVPRRACPRGGRRPLR